MIRALVGIVGLVLLSYLAAYLFLMKADSTLLPPALGMGGAGCIIVWVLISIGAGERGGRLRR